MEEEIKDYLLWEAPLKAHKKVFRKFEEWH
jgi:hypothetical protein